MSEDIHYTPKKKKIDFQRTLICFDNVVAFFKLL